MFKIGQRVRIMGGHDDFPESLQGQTGNVVDVEDDSSVWVIPDKPVAEAGAADSRWLFDPTYLSYE